MFGQGGAGHRVMGVPTMFGGLGPPGRRRIVLYLILLAPLAALGLLVTMSSLERWHDTHEQGGPAIIPLVSPATLPMERGSS
jgi:hypothetical protein